LSQTRETEKKAAGEHAADLVCDGQFVGLGTGSTSAFAIRRLGERVQNEGLKIKCVGTSVKTEQLARECSLEISEIENAGSVDIYIDGADQVTQKGQMVKGGGGALLREKIVARHSKKRIIIVDQSKVVPSLGIGFDLPVEVVPFCSSATQKLIETAAGCQCSFRTVSGKKFVTDEAHFLLDCHFEDGIEDPGRMAKILSSLPGVVEHGLFIGLCDQIVIGREGDVEVKYLND